MTQGTKDKVVVITGASSGLGEATARYLARHGVIADRSPWPVKRPARSTK